MIKLSMVRLYRTEDVPDHVIEEVNVMIGKLSKVLTETFMGHDSNIVLSALNRIHAGIICSMLTENGLIAGAKTEAIGLIKNIEHISGIKVMQSEDNQ